MVLKELSLIKLIIGLNVLFGIKIFRFFNCVYSIFKLRELQRTAGFNNVATAFGKRSNNMCHFLNCAKKNERVK